MMTDFRRSVLVSTLVVAALATLAGCSTIRHVFLSLDALMFRTEPDYEALEADRRQAEDAQAVAVFPLPETEAAADWPGFLGPRRDASTDGRPVLAEWPSDGLPVLWRQPIGGGYSSFAVAGGMAFTLEQRRDNEAVTAYEVATGRELWIHQYPALFGEPFSGEGPRATPSYYRGRVYSVGAAGEVCCLEAESGESVWQRNVLLDTAAKNLRFGISGSPLVAAGRLIVLSGEPHQGGHSVVAYDLDSGEIEWTAVGDKQAYVSPMLVSLAGRQQLLVVTAARIVGLELAAGALLWQVPWEVFEGLSCSQPVVVGPNRVLVSGGYGAGAVLVEIQPSVSGYEPKLVWQNKRLRSKFNSMVYHEGYVYGLDEGILVCLDVATGERQWKAGRYGYGQLLRAGGHLLVLGGKGDLVLVRATPDGLEELSRFKTLEGNTWTPPALAGSRLLIRNAAEMVCYELDPPRG